MGRAAQDGLIDSLETTVRGLEWQPKGTIWANYYDDTNYSEAALARKTELVDRFVARTQPGVVWDLGANTGRFSRLASQRGIQTIAFDMDPAAVDKNYAESVRGRETHLLPLVLDLTNPSSGIGWAGEERLSLQARGPADLVLALALIHHLAIGNNVPLDRIAALLSAFGRALVIEFVPKSDSQVQRLLASREDVFPTYAQDVFEAAFARYFDTLEVARIPGTERTLYLMQQKA
jgi:ribosomal protein L11 methylase PrmA